MLTLTAETMARHNEKTSAVMCDCVFGTTVCLLAHVKLVSHLRRIFIISDGKLWITKFMNMYMQPAAVRYFSTVFCFPNLSPHVNATLLLSLTNLNMQHEYACSVRVVADVDAVVGAIHKYLDRVTLHGPVTLDKLMQIEHKLMSDFQFAHFAMLDHGTFLEFILNQPDVKKVTHL